MQGTGLSFPTSWDRPSVVWAEMDQGSLCESRFPGRSWGLFPRCLPPAPHSPCWLPMPGGEAEAGGGQGHSAELAGPGRKAFGGSPLTDEAPEV